MVTFKFEEDLISSFFFCIYNSSIFIIICDLLQKSSDAGTGQITLPEDLGRECALKLLDEIHRGGAVDSSFQWILALWMALGQKDVSECVVSILNSFHMIW